MEKRKPKPELSEAKQKELNESWDEFADSVRKEMASGDMEPAKACAVGLTLDMTWDSAKTTYISISMLKLAIELVEFLDKFEGDGHSEQRDEAKNETIEEYKAEIAKLENPEVAKANAEAKEKAEKEVADKAEAEKAHLHAPAEGIFATCTVASILASPMLQGLPNR